MTRYLIPIVILAALLLPGCKAGMIHVDAIKPNLDIILDRHDGYINGDAGLSDVAKRTALRSSDLLRQVVAAAEKDK